MPSIYECSVSIVQKSFFVIPVEASQPRKAGGQDEAGPSGYPEGEPEIGARHAQERPERGQLRKKRIAGSGLRLHSFRVLRELTKAKNCRISGLKNLTDVISGITDALGHC